MNPGITGLASGRHGASGIEGEGGRQRRRGMMPARRVRLGVMAIGLSLALAATGCADNDGSSESSAAAGTSGGSGASGASGDNDTKATVSGAAESAAATWTVFGNGTDNARFQGSETKLTAKTVGQLGERWNLELGKGISSTPMVVDGIVYVGTWGNEVLAIDAASGKVKWRSPVDSSVMSSVTVDGDDLYVATNGSLFRFDRATGKQRWTAKVSDHPIAITPGSPVVVDGLVVIGTASGELMIPVDDYRFRGSIAAFTADTGAEAWRVWLTAGDETEGNGVGIWSTPSVDADRGLIFIGTGNTYEPPAADRADAIMAINYRDGSVKWVRQFTKEDVWSTGHLEGLDADVGAGPNLWTVDDTDMVGAGDKQGTYHALDRETGEILWETKMTPGSALGGVIGTSAFDGEQLLIASNVGTEGSNAPGSGTKVLALDAATGEKNWETPLDGSVFAPVTASPGLVWVGTTAGKFVVLDATDGKVLWTRTAPDQVGSGASIVDGTVYWGYGYALFGTGSGKGGMYAFDLESGGDAAAPSGASGASGASGLAIPSRGEFVYAGTCASCHGPTGKGGVGPTLVGIDQKLTLEQHNDVVRNGRTGTQMAGFAETLSDDDIDAVIEYQRTVLAKG